MENEMESCSTQFFQGTFTKQCILFFTAKINDLVIFLLSFTLRIPQIILMLKQKSVKGLSAMSIYVDFLSTFFQGLYCYHNSLPITIYVDIINLAIQNFIIILLFWYYSKKENNFTSRKIDLIVKIIFVIIIVIISYICILMGDFIPVWVWTIMASSNIPFVALSRITQMLAIVRTKETKSISSMAFLMRFIKNLLKSLSIIIETKAYILLINQLFNASMNITLVFLISIYRKNKKFNEKFKKVEQIPLIEITTH